MKKLLIYLINLIKRLFKHKQNTTDVIMNEQLVKWEDLENISWLELSEKQWNDFIK